MNRERDESKRGHNKVERKDGKEEGEGLCDTAERQIEWALN